MVTSIGSNITVGTVGDVPLGNYEKVFGVVAAALTPYDRRLQEPKSSRLLALTLGPHSFSEIFNSTRWHSIVWVKQGTGDFLTKQGIEHSIKPGDWIFVPFCVAFCLRSARKESMEFCRMQVEDV